MKNIAVIYHDADFDGKLSNETCRYWLARLYPDAKVHSYGWDYGRATPMPYIDKDRTTTMGWPLFDKIYIVDLSVDELMSRPELRDKIVWIDHHKSAIDKWVQQGDKKYGFQFTGYRIDGVAACRLCWQWFSNDRGPYGDPRTHPSDYWIPAKEHYVNRSVQEPELIRIAGEYDIWDHRDPDAKALQFGLRAIDDNRLTMLITDQFQREPGRSAILDAVIQQGHAIKSYCDRNNSEYAAQYAHTIQWEGLTFCALNIGQRGNSDLLAGGIKPEHQALFAWRWTGDAVLVSLYHAPGHTELDLSQIAVRYGGGGHRGACGFRITLKQLEEIIGV